MTLSTAVSVGMCPRQSPGVGCVEDIYFVVAVVESHYRSRHRNASLFFDFHPVAGGGLLYLVALYGSGYVYRATEKKEFFGKCGLAGVGVGYDGESSPGVLFHRRCRPCGQMIFMAAMHLRSDACQWGIDIPNVALILLLSSTVYAGRTAGVV